jgi:hypothetical protein
LSPIIQSESSSGQNIVDMKFDIGIEKRKFILTVSLLVENFTSIFLSRLLEIKDHRQTISFSNKSSNLSFNQKINLLIDIGAIPAGQRNKFLTFMEIRNQFMHNLEAKSYETCFDFIDGKDKFVLKTYPQDPKKSREEQLEKATEELSNEVLSMSAKLYDKVKEKIEKEVRFDTLEKVHPVLIKAIADIEKKRTSANNVKAKSKP